MPVENLRRRGSRVGDRPVVDSGVRDHPNYRVRHPLPEHDILIVDVGLDFLLRLDVEHLKGSTSYPVFEYQVE